MLPANPFRGKTKKKKTGTNPDKKSDRPDLPETPIPAKPPKLEASTKFFSKEIIPLQNDSTCRRMEDLDDDEYGYNLVGVKCSGEKERDTDFENKFIDAKEFGPYNEETHNPAISRVFYSPKGNYKGICVEDICQKINNAKPADQEDMKKYVNTQMLPHLKGSKKIDDIFTFLSCKSLRKPCIRELTETLFDIDYGQFSRKELMDLYEKGTDQLLTVVSESRTSKSTSLFPLIELGIVFSCFIYLHAIESREEWIPCIQRVITSKKSIIKRVTDKHDPDIKVFAKTANCIFELEKMELDKSMILGDETEDFLTEFKWESKCIYVEGLAALYHTGNLILREKSLLKDGVQRLVGLSSLMNESEDPGMVKWFHHLLVQFVVRVLQQDYPNVKCETLVRCENQLSSILKKVKLNPEDNDLLHCLLFSKNERVRSMYEDIAKARGLKCSHAVTQIYIETFLLDKCGFSFEKSASQSQVSSSVERKLCKFCKVNGSITCFYDVFPEESADFNLYDNTSTAKGDSSQNCYKKENLENEFEVLKEIESKDFHVNVARLLAFSQSFPKFYIKERLPGDNLQRRLLKARDKKIPIVNLIRIIIQAVKAVIYVHSQGCLIRDITTASYGCTVSDNDYFIKLKNFEMAAKPSDFTENGIVKGVMDLNFQGVPIRWAAPESLLNGHYSIYSDVWSVNILADEILNYAAWPYTDISDADIEEMVTNVVFTHLKPQGFNRPRRVQGLILEGLSSDPNQRLKLEALKERLIEILDNEDGGESCSLYDRYSLQEGCRLKTKSYYIPPLTEIQLRSNSIFKRGIPDSIQKFRNLDGDPLVAFHREAAEYNSYLKRQIKVELIEISSNENYKIDRENNNAKNPRYKVTEKVTDEFQKFTYQRLSDIDGSNMCIKPWPPQLNPAGNEFKLEYTIPGYTHLLEIVLKKEHGEAIDPYIQLLFDLAKHVDSLHSAGWIFRCLRAKNVLILDTNSKKGKQTIVVPKFGKYRTIFSPDIDDHMEQVKIENKEEKEDVRWLPIEAIKAGLYSKESDVYAFGMVTWEVMTAFGQGGVVYDQDEDQELKCIPFNYQESENILQHLIKGYIPEKPAKCPDWFYQEITRPCLLHQKIDRPSMKTVIQILQTRLEKTIPKQISSITSTQLKESNDADVNASKGNVPRSNKGNERLNDRYKNTSQKQFHSLPTSEPDTPNYINEKMYENEKYACVETNTEEKGNTFSSLRTRSTQQTHKGLPNVVEYDYVDDCHDERGGEYDDAISLPKLTPFCLKKNKEDITDASYYNTEKGMWRDGHHNSPTSNEATDDFNLPVMTRVNRDENQNQEPDIHKKAPPVPRRKDSIHIPNTSVMTCENIDKEQGVKIAYVKPIPPVGQNLDSNYGSAKNEEGPIPHIIVSENQPSDSKMRAERRSFNISDESLQSVNKSSDFDATQSNAIHDEKRDTFKGSDFVEIFSRSSQERSNIDLTVHINKYTNVIVESSPAIQTTRRRVPPEPKTDPRSNIYVNEQGTEVDSNPTGVHVYVNEKQTEAKPPVPPRKPMSK